MRSNTQTGRGKHLLVDGSDPTLARVSRPKSLRASEVAPVHSVTAGQGGSAGVSRVCTGHNNNGRQMPVQTNGTANSFKGDRPCHC